MKRTFILMMLCASTIFARGEYVNDKHCIYAINPETLKAEVVNFCTEETSVTIPSTFSYLGDIYTVTSISYKDFDHSGLKYAWMDLGKKRSRIIELKLPSTITDLGGDAFMGLTRLKKIIIPKSVKNCELFSWTSPFYGNSRLENITFLGLEEIGVPSEEKWEGEKYNVYSDPITFEQILFKEIKKKAPNLKSIDLPHLKNVKEYKKYNDFITDTIVKYNNRLSSHTYYFVPKTDRLSTQLSKDEHLLEDSYKGYGSAILKKGYDKKLTEIRVQYQKLTSSMENLNKIAQKIDSVYHLYRCKYTINQVADILLENKCFSDPNCQETQFESYGYLFKSKDIFLQKYNNLNLEEFNIEIAKREDFYKKFEGNNLEYLVFKNAIKKGYSEVRSVISDYNRLKKEVNDMCNWAATTMINKNSKMLAEYNKTKIYWETEEEFFEAYISETYKQILKEKKKSKK